MARVCRLVVRVLALIAIGVLAAKGGKYVHAKLSREIVVIVPRCDPGQRVCVS
jgi:hypothetical protein